MHPNARDAAQPCTKNPRDGVFYEGVFYEAVNASQVPQLISGGSRPKQKFSSSNLGFLPPASLPACLPGVPQEPGESEPSPLEQASAVHPSLVSIEPQQDFAFSKCVCRQSFHKANPLGLGAS